jgi:hypothetical protein
LAIPPKNLLPVLASAAIHVRERNWSDIRHAASCGVAEDDDLLAILGILGPNLAEVVARVRRRVGGKGNPEGCFAEW